MIFEERLELNIMSGNRQIDDKNDHTLSFASKITLFYLRKYVNIYGLYQKETNKYELNIK